MAVATYNLAVFVPHHGGLSSLRSNTSVFSDPHKAPSAL